MNEVESNDNSFRIIVLVDKEVLNRNVTVDIIGRGGQMSMSEQQRWEVAVLKYNKVHLNKLNLHFNFYWSIFQY